MTWVFQALLTKWKQKSKSFLTKRMRTSNAIYLMRPTNSPFSYATFNLGNEATMRIWTGGSHSFSKRLMSSSFPKHTFESSTRTTVLVIRRSSNTTSQRVMTFLNERLHDDSWHDSGHFGKWNEIHQSLTFPGSSPHDIPPSTTPAIPVENSVATPPASSSHAHI